MLHAYCSHSAPLLSAYTYMYHILHELRKLVGRTSDLRLPAGAIRLLEKDMDVGNGEQDIASDKDAQA